MDVQKPCSSANAESQPPQTGTTVQENLGNIPSDQQIDLLQSVHDAQKSLDLIKQSSGYHLNNALGRYRKLEDVDAGSLSLSAKIRLLDSKSPLPWQFDHSITRDSIMNVSTLCEICRTVNFQWLLHNKTRVFEGPFLGSLEAVVMRRSCSFCRLVVRFLEQTYFLHETHPFTCLEAVKCYLSGVEDSDGEFYVMLMDHDDLKFRFGVRRIGEALGDARLVPQVLDFNLIKSWLTQSEVYDLTTSWIRHSKGEVEYLSSSNRNSEKMIKLESEFRLIDAKKKCVVRSSTNNRYITLSYVWGSVPKTQLEKHNRHELETEGSLSRVHLLGNTILDAISLIERLGERYLWVDSLCIIQDDPISRQTQLSSMEEIYRSSLVTIVANSGKDSNARIPGVTEGSRNTVQVVETVGDIELVTGLGKFYSFFDRCKWNTRAWTYQEQLLSPRLLFIAPEQVFLKSTNLNFQEDTNYKRRSLSYPKIDFWNAFSGIAPELRTLFRGPILEGLPQTEIEEALLWYWDNDSEQMKDDDGTYLCPSYSWLGWTGPNNDSRIEQGPIELFRQNPDHRTRLQWRHVFNDKGRYYYRTSQPDLYFLHPVDPEPERMNSIQLQVVRGNVLRFKAQTVLLYLSKKHRPTPIYHTSNGIPTIRECKDGVHDVCSLSVLDEHGYLAGSVEVPGSVSAELPEGKYEFLALSRPYDHDMDLGPTLPQSTGLTFSDGSTVGNSDPYT
ncbi:hypothetical protein OIDMADRAFT_52766 [Oidiodendron maius Zn]|uniref:Heterokaryon incompatibility domain-containing protein n=1 Tax=Oidiodendron maius (strain Zn) TaxID=913774 RepID=A0A0C3HIM6_OIDMZ|nr:hypothetical protein OIDMADRAFT_52766 [Oidiodendron maius Zn]